MYKMEGSLVCLLLKTKNCPVRVSLSLITSVHPPHPHIVFGVELTTLVKMQSTKVPVVIKDCIEEIEKRGKKYIIASV